MQQLLQEFKNDLTDFREMTKKFYAGEVSQKDYKGFSGGFGSYAQRGGKVSMLRLRLPGGRLPKEKLKFVADIIAQYQVKRVHFTTCQTIQLHDLSEQEVCRSWKKHLTQGSSQEAEEGTSREMSWPLRCPVWRRESAST